MEKTNQNEEVEPKAAKAPKEPKAAKAKVEEDVQLEIPKSTFDELRSKKYSLAHGSILMPELIEGRMEWVTVPQNRFDQKAQDRLFDFWKKMNEDEPKFDIEAKVKKLLVEVK